MTSSNHDGHGAFPMPEGRRQAPHRAPHPDGAADGSFEGEAHLDLDGGNLLDPAFVARLANELYAEGFPPGQGIEAAGAAEMAWEAAAAPRPGGHPSLPGSDFIPAGRPRGIDFQEPHLFPGGDELMLPHLAGLEEGLGMHAQGEGEVYYFLRPAAPTRKAVRQAPHPAHSFPVEAIRQDFPALQQKVHGKPLIWMDNAATTQKPRRVIEALARFYEHDNSNTRAKHALAARVTGLYQDARDRVRRFLGASAPEEIVFTRGCTEAINLVAQAYGRKFIRKGDEIVLSTLEHHSNIVPWQLLAQEKEAVLRVIPVNDRGEILLEEYEKLLGPRTRLVAIAHVSNALGTVLPVAAMTQMAHRHGARVLVDGAQSVPHMPVDVQALGCDFFVFAGHKLFGPTGVGVLHGRRDVLEEMPPWQGGGGMMEQVTFEHTTYRPVPARFEAGTASLAGAIGLAAAIDYVDEVGRENIRRYEHGLLAYATAELSGIPGLRLIGTPAERAGVLSFVLEGVDSEEVGRILDQEGIAVRVGRHCAQPTMKRFGVTATVRPSLAFYNTHAEVDCLVAATRRAKARR